MNKIYLVYGDDREAMLAAAKSIRSQSQKAHLRTLSGWVGDVENCDGVAIVGGPESDREQVAKLTKAYEGKIVTATDFSPRDDASEKTEAEKKAAAEKAEAEKKVAAEKAEAEKAEATKKAEAEKAAAAAAAKAPTK